MTWLILLLINTALMALAVVIHYETLYHSALRLPQIQVEPRLRVLLGVAVILVAHIVEIWLFACGYFVLLHIDGMGHMLSSQTGQPIVADLMECAYFSFITFTTVGYGDIVATDKVRYLTGIESLTGFVLITWSASFVFLEMQKYWPLNHRTHKP